MSRHRSTTKVDARLDGPSAVLNLDAMPYLVIEMMWEMLDCGHDLLGRTKMKMLLQMKRIEIASETLAWVCRPIYKGLSGAAYVCSIRIRHNDGTQERALREIIR